MNPPSNPPASAPAGMFILKGLATIRWGTDGFLQDAPLQSAIVDSIKPSRRVNSSQIENNSGFEVAEILLIQGQDYDITFTDDTSKSFPDTGGKILLQGSDDATAIECLVVEDDYEAAKKQPGKRHIKAKAYSAFTVS